MNGDSGARTPEQQAERIKGVLDDYHKMLCDDQRDMRMVEHVVAAFCAAGLITEEESRLRRLALNGCPGHDGPRVWCAYCGELPEEKDDER